MTQRKTAEKIIEAFARKKDIPCPICAFNCSDGDISRNICIEGVRLWLIKQREGKSEVRKS